MTNKTIDIFKQFIDDYNAIGYGEARVYETPRYIVIELWNAGFSENEGLESEFIKRKTAKRYLVYDWHPSKVFCINKPMFTMFNKLTYDVFKPLRETKIYSKKKKYKFDIEFD